MSELASTVISFLAKMALTVTPVSESNKSLEVTMYKAALYCKISSLMLIFHHLFALNPFVSCFAVVNHFAMLPTFQGHAPRSQLYHLEQSWVCPCNLITEQLGYIFKGSCYFQ